MGDSYAIEVWDCKGVEEFRTVFHPFYMRRVTYAGGSFVSGDRIVDVVARYAAANANAERAAEIDVPAVDIDGQPIKIGIVLGPASQMFSEPVLRERELEDDQFVAEMEERIQDLVKVSGVDPSP
jgi:hypothetical protein